MTIDEFIGFIQDKGEPLSEDRLQHYETELKATLPDDYRAFLARANGGYVGGRFVYTGDGASGPSIHHIGGFRAEQHFSLHSHRESYNGRIPGALLWIMDDPGGNAICLGLRGIYRGRVYFWDHEHEPDPDEDAWDGSVERAGNITPVSVSFTEFVAGLHDTHEDKEKNKQAAILLARTGTFPPMVEAQCLAIEDAYPEIRQWIGGLCEQIINDKGYLSIHADALSRTLPDLMFWLQQMANSDKPISLAEMHTLVKSWFKGRSGGFGLGGYAPGFIDDWWKDRVDRGILTMHEKGAQFSPAAAAQLRNSLHSLVDNAAPEQP